MTDTTIELEISDVDLPMHNMRTDINRDAIFELAADIKANGLINPITVRPTHRPVEGVPCKTDRRSKECIEGRHQRFELVAGQRRLLAHQFGGIKYIKAVVRELTDDEAFSIMTSENLARTDVHPVDEAAHVTKLLEMKDGDLDAVMQITKRSRDWVESRLNVGRMDDALKEALRTNKVKLGVALILQQITDDIDRAGVLQMAIAQGATVVTANYWLAQWQAGLFGHATAHTSYDIEAPERQRTIVMLRCSIDGEEHPASEFVSLLIHNSNVGYVDAIRDELKKRKSEPELALDVN